MGSSRNYVCKILLRQWALRPSAQHQWFRHCSSSVFRNSSEDAKALLMSEYGTAEDVLRMVDQEKPDEKSLGDDQVLMRMLAVRS